MKKIFFVTILIITFFISKYSFSKSSDLYVGSIISRTIKYRFIDYNLPDGEWEVFDKYFAMIDELSTVRIECISFVQKEVNTIKGAFEICELNLGGLAPNQIGSFFVNEFRNGKYDSCILRPEYFYAKLYTRGGSSNCFLIRHYDVNKEIYFPDDPEDKGGIVRLEKYLKRNNLILPKTMLGRESVIFVPSIKDKWIGIAYAINPELFGAPKIINAKEEKSEYHRDNIGNFPEQKNFILKWSIEQSKLHQQLEKVLNLRTRHMLDFSDLN